MALSRLALLSSEFGLRVEAQGMQGQGLLWKSSLGSSLGASCGTLNPGFGDLVVKFHSWDFQSLEQDKQDFSRVGGGPGQKLQHDQDGLRFCQVAVLPAGAACRVNRVVFTAMSGAACAGTKRNTFSAFATCHPSGPYTNLWLLLLSCIV